MAEAVLTISSKNYSSWSLRGWLLCRMAGLDFVEEVVPVDDPASRAELLLLSPSILVPCLTHNGIRIWDTLAIGEYLKRDQAARGPTAQGPRRPRPLPFDLRRDAFGVRQSAFGAADEPQGAPGRLQGVVGRTKGYRPDFGDLARMFCGLCGPLALRGAEHCGRDVRSRRDALSHLRRAS
jgi:hypothetical protein